MHAFVCYSVLICLLNRYSIFMPEKKEGAEENLILVDIDQSIKNLSIYL